MQFRHHISRNLIALSVTALLGTSALAMTQAEGKKYLDKLEKELAKV